MQTWIALLKGVNVGGKNKLPIKALAESLSGIGLTRVRTYIQSGNLLFCSEEKSASVLAEKIKKAIRDNFGFEPAVLLLTLEQMTMAAQNNPFADLIEAGKEKILHLFFLASKPVTIDQKRMKALILPSELGQLEGTVFYLFAPEGFGNSKLAAQVEKIFAVTATARNWSTVIAIIRLGQDQPPPGKR